MKNDPGGARARVCVCVCSHQEDEVGPLVVERDGRSAERRLVGALRGWMPERLPCQLGVVQLLFKVCSHTHTHTKRNFNIKHTQNFTCIAQRRGGVCQLLFLLRSVTEGLRSLKAEREPVWNPPGFSLSPSLLTPSFWSPSRFSSISDCLSPSPAA